jgi:ascorbate-specific PTS system EIIC-type component UlaA
VKGRIAIRIILPAVLGTIVGFLALAAAIPAESSLSAPLVAMFSPGLKIAELTVPARHESLAFTFGWFLRIAILANAAYYFAIFAVLGYLMTRRRAKDSGDDSSKNVS